MRILNAKIDLGKVKIVKIVKINKGQTRKLKQLTNTDHPVKFIIVFIL